MITAGHCREWCSTKAAMDIDNRGGGGGAGAGRAWSVTCGLHVHRGKVG